MLFINNIRCICLNTILNLIINRNNCSIKLSRQSIVFQFFLSNFIFQLLIHLFIFIFVYFFLVYSFNYRFYIINQRVVCNIYVKFDCLINVICLKKNNNKQNNKCNFCENECDIRVEHKQIKQNVQQKQF